MRLFFFIALLFFPLFFFASAKRETVVYDTSQACILKTPAAEKEKEIFSDKDYDYSDLKGEQHSENWFRALINWFIRKLFGKVSDANAELTWNIIKWIFIGLFITGVIILIYKSRFRGMLRPASKQIGGAVFTDLPEDITGIDLDKLIRNALQNQDYRLAIRWCFLKSLQKLNDSKLINWSPSKTNIDYELELKSTGQRTEFGRLCYIFEHVWYGEVGAGEGLFGKYREQSEQFNAGIHAQG